MSSHFISLLYSSYCSRGRMHSSTVSVRCTARQYVRANIFVVTGRIRDALAQEETGNLVTLSSYGVIRGIGLPEKECSRNLARPFYHEAFYGVGRLVCCR